MKEKKILITLSLMLVLLGIPLLMNAEITGNATMNTETFTNPILGLLFIMVSTILFMSSRKLEDILGKESISIKDLEKNREKFIKNHFLAYKDFLEKERKFPKSIKSEKDKFEYAKQELKKKFEPLTEYNDKSAIEYIEHFGHSPERKDLKVIDPDSELPVKVNYAIKEKCFIDLTEKAEKDKKMWRAAEAKIFRLSEGNLGPLNTGHKFVENTCGKFMYIKDKKSGARIFLEKLSENEYNLVGVVSGQQKKKDESKAIEKCKELYIKKYKCN